MNSETKFFIGIGVLTIVAIVGGAIFLGNKPSKEEASQTLGAVDQNSLIADAVYTIGDPNALVQVVEFSDFQCPACKSAHTIVKKILETKGDQVYFVFRHYPLSIHKNGKTASQAAESAGSQGKFFEMSDLIFENQKDWQDANNAKEIFEGYAKQLELDVDKFKDEFDNGTGRINSDFALGNKSGVESTPTFFINGQKYPGVMQLDQFEQTIDTIVGPVGATSTSEPLDPLPEENQ
ncbi:hypothetical protein A2164_03915 [Candidatus Curtissbacteria bacterium RBG_13_35_7]|uniref:Thioredoxin domain-containing protein n=1 Tax=Candidatus Curtissbacteria bacterium RBG_13_35_7 TaxID=1797705 RepID=A0A1F5G2S3_9BACT|nr:MAG: hypothetical protein A2164_03915 [Candidatus Curtissbacteria bacterium RBG_13_35_7]